MHAILKIYMFIVIKNLGSFLLKIYILNLCIKIMLVNYFNYKFKPHYGVLYIKNDDSVVNNTADTTQFQMIQAYI